MVDPLTKLFQSSAGFCEPDACPEEGSIAFGAAAGWSWFPGTEIDSVARVCELGVSICLARVRIDGSWASGGRVV